MEGERSHIPDNPWEPSPAFVHWLTMGESPFARRYEGQGAKLREYYSGKKPQRELEEA